VGGGSGGGVDVGGVSVVPGGVLVGNWAKTRPVIEL
jgi:hypothetical protein